MLFGVLSNYSVCLVTNCLKLALPYKSSHHLENQTPWRSKFGGDFDNVAVHSVWESCNMDRASPNLVIAITLAIHRASFHSRLLSKTRARWHRPSENNTQTVTLRKHSPKRGRRQIESKGMENLSKS